MHSEIAKGTLKSILEQAEIELDDFLEKHKFFSVACTSFLTLSFVNFYLIYTFMKVLQNI